MKKTLILFSVFAVLLTAVLNDSAFAQASKEYKGRVVLVNSLVTGGDGSVTMDKANALAEKGQPLAFLVGKGKKAKLYFVFNTDGTYASKRLAANAEKADLVIKGKVKTVNGLNILTAESIQ